MPNLINVDYNSPRPAIAANIAYFAVKPKTSKSTNIYFADKGDASNGSIDPVFVLAAFALDDKPDKSYDGDTYYNIYSCYVVSPQWLTAFYGISNVARTQSKEDKLVLGSLKQSNQLPDNSPDTKWHKVSLKDMGNLPVTPPTGIVDNLFVPERSKFATSEENWFLIGNPVWGTHTIPRLYMMAAIVLETERKASVVSMVVNHQGVIVAHGIKGPKDGGCSHAEVRTIFSLKGNLPAQGGAIFSTLKPCTMCAGLLHAVDATGRFRKYWVRDDANAAADWTKIDKTFTLASGHQLDKGCSDVKYLKTGGAKGGKSFFEEFGEVRKGAQKTADSKRAPEATEKLWYQQWAQNYQFPSNGIWSDLRFRSGPPDNTIGQRSLIKPAFTEKTVAGSMSLTTFISQHLAIKDNSKKGWRGLSNKESETIMNKYDEYRKEQFEKNYSHQIIKIIAWNPDSVALSNSVKDAFKAKQLKYKDPEFRNPKVKAVLDYLTNYLGHMNIAL